MIKINKLLNTKNVLTVIKDTFDDTYEFEIAAIDFWCLDAGLDYEKIYVTPERGDGKIDGIVKLKKNRYNSKNVFYIFQISTGTKNKKALVKFSQVQAHKKYSHIISPNDICMKVVITIGKSHLDDDNIEFITSDNLAKRFYSICITNNIIVNSSFSEEYLENVKERAKILRNFHSSKKAKENLIEEYSDMFLDNFYAIRRGSFTSALSFSKIISFEKDQLIDIVTSDLQEKFIIKMKDEIINRCGLKYDESKDRLLRLIGSILDYNQHQDIIIKPQKKYLSIKIRNKRHALAHLSWGYDSPTNNNGFFGFKCLYDDLGTIDKSNLRVKRIKEVNNPFKYCMNTALINPDLAKDRKIIKRLIFKSYEYFVKPNKIA